MAVSLSKGGNVSLTKEAPTMKTAMVALGWDQGEPAQRTYFKYRSGPMRKGTAPFDARFN